MLFRSGAEGIEGTEGDSSGGGNWRQSGSDRSTPGLYPGRRVLTIRLSSKASSSWKSYPQIPHEMVVRARASGVYRQAKGSYFASAKSLSLSGFSVRKAGTSSESPGGPAGGKEAGNGDTKEDGEEGEEEPEGDGVVEEAGEGNTGERKEADKGMSTVSSLLILGFTGLLRGIEEDVLRLGITYPSTLVFYEVGGKDSEDAKSSEDGEGSEANEGSGHGEGSDGSEDSYIPILLGLEEEELLAFSSSEDKCETMHLVLRTCEVF